MSANSPVDPEAFDAAEPVVRLRRRQVSVVWLVPVVAALIGGWLIYKAISEKGPVITITFKTAEGLEAGKTKIKFKDVDIGLVEQVTLSQDRSHVIVRAQLVKEAESYLSEDSRFWVVRARVSASMVSGLSTVFSGAYIGVDIGKSGTSGRHFTGLEDPPLVTAGEIGRHFTLTADRKGSLDIGSPVYFRQYPVGRVVGYSLSHDGQNIVFTVFINAPYDGFVRTATRFWNASGFDMKLDAEGIQIDTESVVSLLIGGVAFDIVESFEGAGEPAKDDVPFTLFPNREAARQRVYADKRFFLLHFDTSVRGLAPGAPVEFRGISIGKVIDLKLEFDVQKMRIDIPVLIMVEPERFTATGGVNQPGENGRVLDTLVEKGLRAQLRAGSLITGQQFVALDFFPGAPAARMIREGPYPSIPTIPTQFEEIGAKISQVITKLDRVPIDQIGNDLRDTMRGARRITNSPDMLAAVKSLNAAIQELHLLVTDLRTRTTPEMNATLLQAQASLSEAARVLESASPLQLRLKTALDEISAAARALRALTDYLERNPQSILTGKESPQ